MEFSPNFIKMKEVHLRNETEVNEWLTSFRFLLAVLSYWDLFFHHSLIINFVEVYNIYMLNWQLAVATSWLLPKSTYGDLNRLSKNPHFVTALQPRKQAETILSQPGLSTDPAFTLIFIYWHRGVSCIMGWKLPLLHFQKTSKDFGISHCVRQAINQILTDNSKKNPESWTSMTETQSSLWKHYSLLLPRSMKL